jgi:hypothetical protein
MYWPAIFSPSYTNVWKETDNPSFHWLRSGRDVTHCSVTNRSLGFRYDVMPDYPLIGWYFYNWDIPPSGSQVSFPRSHVVSMLNHLPILYINVNKRAEFPAQEVAIASCLIRHRTSPTVPLTTALFISLETRFDTSPHAHLKPGNNQHIRPENSPECKQTAQDL